MCGIAAFSFSNEALTRGVNAKKVARALLMGIEHRGKDATGFAFIDSTGAPQVHKRAMTASEFLRTGGLTLPKRAQSAVLHTRAWTTGSPSRNENNHPIRQGTIVGVHNGWLTNDDVIWTTLLDTNLRNAEVDSEAIFALIAHGPERVGMSVTDALATIEGPAAVAWMDTEIKDTLFLARASSSPLFIGQTVDGSVIAASTMAAVAEAAKAGGLELEKIREAEEGTMFTVENGDISDVRTFDPTPAWSTSARPGRRITSDGWETTSVVTKQDGTRSVRLGTSTPNAADGRLAQAIDTFSSDEYDLWSSMRLTALEDANERDEWATDWVERSAFDQFDAVPLANEGEAAYYRAYPRRERAIETWLSGLNGVDFVTDTRTAANLKAFVRPGTDVTTRVMGYDCDAQVVQLPHSFPEGKYLLRVLIRKSPVTAGEEVILVEREHYEFRVKPDQLTLSGIPAGGDRAISPVA